MYNLSQIIHIFVHNSQITIIILHVFLQNEFLILSFPIVSYFIKVYLISNDVYIHIQNHTCSVYYFYYY